MARQLGFNTKQDLANLPDGGVAEAGDKVVVAVDGCDQFVTKTLPADKTVTYAFEQQPPVNGLVDVIITGTENPGGTVVSTDTITVSASSLTDISIDSVTGILTATNTNAPDGVPTTLTTDLSFMINPSFVDASDTDSVALTYDAGSDTWIVAGSTFVQVTDPVSGDVTTTITAPDGTETVIVVPGPDDECAEYAAGTPLADQANPVLHGCGDAGKGTISLLLTPTSQISVVDGQDPTAVSMLLDGDSNPMCPTQGITSGTYEVRDSTGAIVAQGSALPSTTTVDVSKTLDATGAQTTTDSAGPYTAYYTVVDACGTSNQTQDVFDVAACDDVITCGYLSTPRRIDLPLVPFVLPTPAIQNSHTETHERPDIGISVTTTVSSASGINRWFNNAIGWTWITQTADGQNIDYTSAITIIPTSSTECACDVVVLDWGILWTDIDLFADHDTRFTYDNGDWSVLTGGAVDLGGVLDITAEETQIQGVINAPATGTSISGALLDLDFTDRTAYRHWVDIQVPVCITRDCNGVFVSATDIFGNVVAEGDLA